MPKNRKLTMHQLLYFEILYLTGQLILVLSIIKMRSFGIFFIRIDVPMLIVRGLHGSMEHISDVHLHLTTDIHGIIAVASTLNSNPATTPSGRLM
jgi:hypothetical protein